MAVRQGMGTIRAGLENISESTPVLIAGPTASGKSALALEIAEARGGVIVNADALQVYADWRILTARPPDGDLARADHYLYGHIPGDQAYSVGDWLRAAVPFLSGSARPIFVGGTGLYFRALTEGLADIPVTPSETRALADGRMADEGPEALLAELDADTRARIDRQNPVRVQRAWEVQATTGRGLAAWQDETGPPALPLSDCVPILVDADRDWLAKRIEKRFELMVNQGVMEEARSNAPTWHPGLPSAKAIGAAELVSVACDEMSLDTARERIVALTRQYAKRQRTWFRGHMQGWQQIVAG